MENVVDVTVNALPDELVVVTASADPERTLKYWRTWREKAATPFRLVLVVGGKGTEIELGEEVEEQLVDGDVVVMRDLDGTIPAFYSGVVEACVGGVVPKVIACFHDDMQIDEQGWDLAVRNLFMNENVLLAGFGGGTGLGAADIYDTPYSPYQLARRDFVSNMRDAEMHGRRGKIPERVACTDGFSIIGRGEFIIECYTAAKELGIVHHFYDSLFGAWCKAAGGEAWFLPVACHHAGGVTAVGNEAYQKFARSRNVGGDGYFWEEAHKIGYEQCRGILPFSVKEEK